MTRFLRGIKLAIHISRGLFTATLILPRVPAERRDAIIGKWSRQLLDVFNIRLVIHGDIPDIDKAGVMFIANHVSWLDIHAINAVRAVRFIAMAEIRQWPVLGWLATQANTLFTDRSKRHDASRMVGITAESLRSGDRICYFPEGTTTDGNTLEPFKNSLLQAAIDADACVCPIAIRYPGPDGTINTDLSYVDATLLQSLGKVLAQQGPIVELFFGEPIMPAGQDRKGISSQARAFIGRSLGLDY
jgi:1-acyl-sn-glycerol-3-phosphate acyltransferase